MEKIVKKFLFMLVISIVVVLLGFSVFFFMNIEGEEVLSITIEGMFFTDTTHAVLKGEFYIEKKDIDFNFSFSVYVYNNEGFEICDYELLSHYDECDLTVIFKEESEVREFYFLTEHKAEKSGFEYHITPSVWWFDKDGSHEVFGDEFVYVSP